MEEAAERLSPILYLHKDEEHYPSTPDHYLENMDIIVDEIVRLRSPTQEHLLQFVNENPEEAPRARMVPNDPHSSVLFGNSTLTSPTYVFVQDFNSEFIYLTYCYFFNYNKSYNVLGLSYIGEHNADIEHVTVELNRNSLEPTRYYLSAHGHSTGSWYTLDELEYEEGRPVVYVSNGSHALYNKSGVVWRLGGVANDHTMKSYRWNPPVIFVHPRESEMFSPDNSWIYYPGRWAVDGINGVVNQEWYGSLPDKSLHPRIMTHAIWTLIVYASIILGLAALIFISGLISHALKPSFGVDDKQVITGSTLLFGATMYTLYVVLILLTTGTINAVAGRRILTTADT